MKQWDYTVTVLILVGVSSIANGAWMLAAPLVWWAELPADLHHFGPANAHLIRDFGCGLLAVGTGLLLAVGQPVYRQPFVLVAFLFFGLHALVHVYDTASGAVPPSHWLVDFPLTYLPALLLGSVLLRLHRA